LVDLVVVEPAELEDVVSHFADEVVVSVGDVAAAVGGEDDLDPVRLDGGRAVACDEGFAEGVAEF